MSEAKDIKEHSDKKKTGIIVGVAVLLIIIIVLLVVIVYLLSKNNNSDEAADTNNKTREVAAGDARVILDSSDADDAMQEMRETVAEGMFECQMSTTWDFSAGGSSSENAYVANSLNNTHPICFDVYLGDSEDLLYESPVLPVGSDMVVASLNKTLEAGQYEATVVYHLLDDEENQNEISSAGFVITLNISN